MKKPQLRIDALRVLSRSLRMLGVSFDSFVASGVVVTLLFVILSSSPACVTAEGDSRGDVPLLPLPAWEDVGLEYGDQLMLRLVNQNQGGLLMKHSRREVVYRYDAGPKTLTSVGSGEWERAPTPIAECGKQTYPTASVMRIDTQSHRLFVGDRPTSVAGQTVLKLAEAPSGKRVAVLSASGRATTSVLPFSGESGASGQYYHQVLSLPGGNFVGQPLKLPVQRQSDSLIPCWSADEQYVVYYQVTFSYLSIVSTNLSVPPK